MYTLKFFTTHFDTVHNARWQKRTFDSPAYGHSQNNWQRTNRSLCCKQHRERM